MHYFTPTYRSFCPPPPPPPSRSSFIPAVKSKSVNQLKSPVCFHCKAVLKFVKDNTAVWRKNI